MALTRARFASFEFGHRISRFLNASSEADYVGSSGLMSPERPMDHELRTPLLMTPTSLDTYDSNSRIKHLIKTGHLAHARQMFDKMPRRDGISWTTIIAGYVNSSEFGEALALFSTMWVDPTVSMDSFVLSLAVKACGLNMDLHFGESLHGYSVKTGFINSVFVGSALLDMYMKVGITRSGCRLFDEMPVRSVVTWTAVITGLVRCGYIKEGLVYVSEMLISKVEFDSHTYAIALKACADSGALQFGKAIHTRTVKNDFHVTSFVANSLATMYNKCGKLNYGLSLFERMRTRDVVSWTNIIATYVQLGHEVQAIEAFIQMKQSNVSPNEYTFAAVVGGCANLQKGDWGEQLHGHTLQIGLANYFSVANSIISMYSKCGKLSSASTVFNGMARKDIVSWSTIIAGYSHGGNVNEAFELLLLMRREGPSPNEFALANVLSACGKMATLEQGKQLHAHTISIGLEGKSMIMSALINMYSKCGSIGEASRIFNVAKKDDIVSWTAMINGYAEHGCSFEAIDLFKCIPIVGLKPDSVTFIGVLSACSHSGLVDLGFHYFNLMSQDYKISPSKEHYGCMIDLLCRAGRLKDAESMIKSMPYERDDVVWSTLLRACRIHGDVDCGKRVAEQILAIDPNCAGTHITLANIYSSKGRWREAADMRKLMRSKGLVKEPGWSWIKIKDQVFTFVASDSTQAECEEIYGMLALLATGTEDGKYLRPSDPAYVQVLDSLAMVAQHMPVPLLEALLRWRGRVVSQVEYPSLVDLRGLILELVAQPTTWRFTSDQDLKAINQALRANTVVYALKKLDNRTKKGNGGGGSRCGSWMS